MLFDGIKLIDSSTASNFTIESGASLPTGEQEKGELFFQTGVGLFIHDGTAWRKTIVGNDVIGVDAGGTGATSAADALNNLGALPKAGGTMTGALTLAAEPTSSLHAATKQYVDAVVQGLDPKASVVVATTGNITLSGTQTIDGVAVVEGDRVLVKNQTNAAENGIYVVAADAWTRSPDADNSPGQEVTAGMYTFVEKGTVNSATGWNLITPNPIALGTTSLAFTQFGAAVSYVAGTNVQISGNVISVPNSNIPYDIASALIGKPAASATVMRFVAVRGYTIPAGLTGSVAKSHLAATASTVLSLQKNGVQFGTITFGAGSTTGVMAAASATAFASGDVLSVVAPSSQDATFADAEFTIVASLS